VGSIVGSAGLDSSSSWLGSSTPQLAQTPNTLNNSAEPVFKNIGGTTKQLGRPGNEARDEERYMCMYMVSMSVHVCGELVHMCMYSGLK